MDKKMENERETRVYLGVIVGVIVSCDDASTV